MYSGFQPAGVTTLKIITYYYDLIKVYILLITTYVPLTLFIYLELTVQYTIFHIVDFRSARCMLSYDHWSVANTDTRYAPNILGRACFFSLWRLVRPSQDGERTVPLANMLFGAKHANIAQHMRRLDCRVHEETPRPLKLTHGRSIKLLSPDQIYVTVFGILV